LPESIVSNSKHARTKRARRSEPFTKYLEILTSEGGRRQNPRGDPNCFAKTMAREVCAAASDLSAASSAATAVSERAALLPASGCVECTKALAGVLASRCGPLNGAAQQRTARGRKRLGAALGRRAALGKAGRAQEGGGAADREGTSTEPTVSADNLASAFLASAFLASDMLTSAEDAAASAS